ncbi:MAG: FecR domain-containing protein [Methylocystis sp.]
MKILLPCLVAALTAFAGAALAEAVGNVGAVNQSAEGGGRKLSVGSGVEARERITTDAKGSAQIVFRDKSTMTVGHGSSVTINKFVYNGKEGVGEQSAKLTKGALRFVGGAVSHTEGAKIETPSGSMAVRGGMAYVCLNCPQGAVFAALAGEVTVSNKTSTVEIPPGQMVTALRDGAFSPPTPIPPDLLDTLDARFASGAGQDGGASNPPTETGANQQLGDARMPDWTPWQGLGDIGAFWGGNAIVQSQAQSNNQASANGVHVLTTPRPTPSGGNRPPQCSDCGATPGNTATVETR